MKTINFEKKLNQQFADLPNEFVFEQLIYLTSKHRGKHILKLAFAGMPFLKYLQIKYLQLWKSKLQSKIILYRRAVI
jgi:hypothetical protein